MVLIVDTSVWIRFLTGREPYATELDSLLERDEVVGHELVFGELLIGDKGVWGGEKGSAVFSGTFRTTTGIHRRFKPKLLRDFDHPIFVSKGPTALRA